MNSGRCVAQPLTRMRAGETDRLHRSMTLVVARDRLANTPTNCMQEG